MQMFVIHYTLCAVSVLPVDNAAVNHGFAVTVAFATILSLLLQLQLSPLKNGQDYVLRLLI